MDIERFVGKYDPEGVQTSFWENRIAQAIEKPKERIFEQFTQGVESIVDILYQDDTPPDVIVFPMRGSAPIMWGIETITENRHLPQIPFLPVPTGNCSGLADSKSKRIINGAHAFDIYKAYLETFQSVGGSLNKVALVDESQAGASIRMSANILYRLLQMTRSQEPLIAIRAQDSNYPEPWCNPEERRNIRWHTVVMPMPFIDKDAVLPKTLYQSPAERLSEGVYEEFQLIETVENRIAKEALQERLRRTISGI